MKAKIKYLHYQRNGIGGEPFYHCLAIIKDEEERPLEMLVTFRTAVNDTQILWSTCRAVYLNDLSLSWRGDNIAAAINDELDKQMIKNKGSIYDCCTPDKMAASI